MSDLDVRIISNTEGTFALVTSSVILLDDIIYKALLKKGFICRNITGELNQKTSMWSFHCRVEPAINATIGSYRIEQLNNDLYSVTDIRNDEQKKAVYGEFRNPFQRAIYLSKVKFTTIPTG